jgi:hypothetical protein
VESHLDLLSAFLPAEQIRAAYEEAIERRYPLARVRRSEFNFVNCATSMPATKRVDPRTAK